MSQAPFEFAKPARKPLTRQQRLLVWALWLCVAIIGATGGLSYLLYEMLVQQTSRELQSLSVVVADHANRSILAVERSVSKVVEALEARRPANARALEYLGDGPDIASLLDEVAADNPFLVGVFVIGADGKVDQRSRGAMIPADLIAGADFMTSLRRGDPNAFVLSPPFESYTFRTWMVNLSRRISGPDGAFLGAVAGIVDLSAFAELFEKAELKSEGSIAMLAADGQLLSWAPQAEIPFGASLAGSEIDERFLHPRRNGFARVVSYIDGVERMVAVANAADVPVSIMVSKGAPDVTALWLGEMCWIAAIAALAVGAVLVGAARLAFQIDRQCETWTRQEVAERTAEKLKIFSRALDSAAQGVAMFDRRGLLVLHNRRFAEMFGLSKPELTPGVSRDELHGYLNRSGQFKAFEPGIKEPNGCTLSHIHLNDGRIVAHRKSALPEGGWISTYEDVTAHRLAERRIRQLVEHDSLTGLFNRFEFGEQLEKLIEQTRDHGAKLAVFYLDLDRFRMINEGLGPDIGDEALRRTGERLRLCARPEDGVFRMGGDEFAIIQVLETSPGDAERFAERLIDSLREPIEIDGREVACGASIGVSLAPADARDAESLTRNAELALADAKQKGRGRFSFFDPSMRARVAARIELESDLKNAVARRELELFYQPIVSLKDGKLAAFEALMRWRRPTRGLLAPAEFMPIAEEIGLIVEIGAWALSEACRQAAAWPAPLKVTVNFSTSQVHAPGFLASLASSLSDAGIGGSRLVAEITENVMLKDAEKAIAVFHQMKHLGLAVSMDDFGAGYSSLSHLRTFPFDKVKIDRSLVGALGVDPSAATIVRAAIGLAGALGMSAVAEGVETEDQMAFLAEAGCAEAQGYLIGKPMPAADADLFLARAHAWRGEAARSGTVIDLRPRHTSGNPAPALP